MDAQSRLKKTSAPASGEILVARIYWLSTFLLAAAFLSTVLAVDAGSDANWPEALLLLLATASTLADLSRQLPSQNVLFAAFVIALIGGGAHLLGAVTDLPFGPFMFGVEAGPKLFGRLPWAVPLIWVVVVLNSRGVARLVLRPWRKTRIYGIWLIGLTAVLAMSLDCALEPFATHVKHYWIWTATNYSLTAHGAPLSNTVGWLVVTLLMLAFVTPSLINKQLSKRSKPDYHPLAVWLGALILFGVAAATRGFWVEVAGEGVLAVVIAAFAVRGGRW